MLIEESSRRQRELQKHLRDMAINIMDEEQLRRKIAELKPLYTEGFRHQYAEIFPLIVDIAKEDNEDRLESLSNNLCDARSMVEQDYLSGGEEFRGLYQPLRKLSDHVNLEIGRYNHYSQNEQKVDDLEKKNAALQTSLRESTEKLTQAEARLSSVQTELIAVLSIFSAIVLTFAGSINFTGHTLSGLSSAPFGELAFFVALCGIVVFNTIFLLMYFVGKITNRNIYANCNTENCSCGENGKPACCGITRIRKRLPYVFWFNVVMICFVVSCSIVVAWMKTT